MADQKVTPNKTSALQFIRTIYLSLAAVIGLVCVIIGATDAIKLGLNHWFPVDDYMVYYSPTDKSPCSYTYVNGQEVKRSDEEVKQCLQNEADNATKQNTNNFNRQVKDSVALLVVGLPIWILHFWLIQADWKRRKEE